MFKQGFDSFVCVGDSITCTVDGFDLTATVHFDPDTSPRDYDQPGWCFDTTDPKHGRKNLALIKAWEADEWFYCGIVVTVERNGIELSEASLWGVDANFPSGRKSKRNAYLQQVANDLIGETLSEAREAIKGLCEALA